MDASGQALEGDEAILHRHAPNEVGSLIQFDLVAVDIQ